MRYDLDLIASWITPGARVLDLGCGRGDLLSFLREAKGVEGFGVEIDEAKAAEGISRGLSILQGDMTDEVRDYPDQTFDFVVLSQTLQQVHRPMELLREMLRVGQRAVVSFPNFAHWRNRFQLFFQGQAPVTPELPYDWHDTPNIRVITLKDFRRFCAQGGVKAHESAAARACPMTGKGRLVRFLPNLLAAYGVFLLGRE
jgi:methionine biosynthesis protein MetW